MDSRDHISGWSVFLVEFVVAIRPSCNNCGKYKFDEFGDERRSVTDGITLVVECDP